MKIVGITTITNPDYRMDPARECIRQMLEVCDEVVVVSGNGHEWKLQDSLTTEQKNRIDWILLDWPQPKWTLDELPKHLNAGLEQAREIGADWIIKFDADYFIHEREKWQLRKNLETELTTGCMVMSLEKTQICIPGLARQKGDIPICIRANAPVYFGQIRGHYSDLCQPIVWDGKSYAGVGDHMIPEGVNVPEVKRTGVWVWNYGYTFKTYERSKELLYFFDLAHADWYGEGWYGTPLEKITQESSMENFLRMSEGRLKTHSMKIPIEKHPKHIQQKLRNLTLEQFGHSLWGKIKLPV